MSTLLELALREAQSNKNVALGLNAENSKKVPHLEIVHIVRSFPASQSVGRSESVNLGLTSKENCQ